jgi:hypothetical protein
MTQYTQLMKLTESMIRMFRSESDEYRDTLATLLGVKYITDAQYQMY